MDCACTTTGPHLPVKAHGRGVRHQRAEHSGLGPVLHLGAQQERSVGGPGGGCAVVLGQSEMVMCGGMWMINEVERALGADDLIVCAAHAYISAPPVQAVPLCTRCARRSCAWRAPRCSAAGAPYTDTQLPLVGRRGQPNCAQQGRPPCCCCHPRSAGLTLAGVELGPGCRAGTPTRGQWLRPQQEAPTAAVASTWGVSRRAAGPPTVCAASSCNGRAAVATPAPQLGLARGSPSTTLLDPHSPGKVRGSYCRIKLDLSVAGGVGGWLWGAKESCWGLRLWWPSDPALMSDQVAVALGSCWGPCGCSVPHAACVLTGSPDSTAGRRVPTRARTAATAPHSRNHSRRSAGD